MKIEVRKHKELLPRNYEVMVDGVRWARLDRENMATYRIIQEGNNHIIRHGDNDAVPLGNPVTLATQQVFERRWRKNDGPLLTLEERAIALIEQLIMQGKLRDPKTL